MPNEPVHVAGPRPLLATQFSDSEPTVVALEATQPKPVKRLSSSKERNPERTGPAVDKSKLLLPENVAEATPEVAAVLMELLNELATDVGVLDSVYEIEAEEPPFSPGPTSRLAVQEVGLVRETVTPAMATEHVVLVITSAKAGMAVTKRAHNVNLLMKASFSE